MAEDYAKKYEYDKCIIVAGDEYKLKFDAPTEMMRDMSRVMPVPSYRGDGWYNRAKCVNGKTVTVIDVADYYGIPYARVKGGNTLTDTLDGADWYFNDFVPLDCFEVYQNYYTPIEERCGVEFF